MQHGFIDKYSGLDSVIHRIDPRVKIITIGVVVLFIMFTKPDVFFAFLLYGVLIFALIVLSKIPLFFVFKRSLVVMPFVILAALFIPFFKEGSVGGGYSFGTLKLTVGYGGLLIFWNVFIKSLLCMFSMILLSNTTKFADLLKAMETLKVPKLMIMILSFMYRYVFVSIDELMRLKRAKDARTIHSNIWDRFRTLSNIIANLFIRAYERGERVYLAMLSRGFTGEVKTTNNFKIMKKDICFAAIIGCALVLIRTCI